MPETRPISERIDLTYVKRKHWPQTSMFKLSLLACGVVVLGAALLEAGGRIEGVAAQAFYSSGQVTKAHSMFGSNCAACHVADPANPQKASFFMPVSDEKCLDCHQTYAVTHHPNQRLYNGKDMKIEGYAQPVRMSSDCAACHVEHQGYDFDLNRVDDRVCVQCHEHLKERGFAKAGAPKVACILRGVGRHGAEEGPGAQVRAVEGGRP